LKSLTTARNPPAFVLPKKFLNAIRLRTVFMSEGRRVVAGEAILSGIATAEQRQDRSRTERADAERRDETLEALVRQHSRLVYRIAYAVLRRHHDAEDATQETFMRVLRYSSKLAAIEDPKTWLARIAWRVAVDRSRQRLQAHEFPLEDPEKLVGDVASTDPRADETLQGAETAAVLDRLIAALPKKLREPLILSTIEEMSPKEVAGILGINEAAVRSRVFRARQTLKEKLPGRASRK
jgi:RNA polymerase sigma-70 factor (ECF subfamily)